MKWGEIKYPLAVRDRCKGFVEQPAAENQRAFLIAGGAAAALLAGERDKKLITTLGAADAGKAVVRINALKEHIDNLPYHWPPESET